MRGRFRTYPAVAPTALIAVDAPVSSYLLHLGPAVDAGVTLDQGEDGRGLPSARYRRG